MILNRIYSFLHPGAIIGTLPYNIVDGQLIDAVPVMGDFNYIVSQVNANVPALVGNNSFVAAASVGGTSNAITLAPSPIITAYAEGQTFTFHAINSNTGSTTVAVSGLPTRLIRNALGNVLSGAEIVAGSIYTITDTGTYYVLTNGAQGAQILFTPSMTFGGGNTGMTFAIQYGLGWKINNLFFFNAQIELSAKGSSTGTVRITNLPYPILSLFTNGGTQVTMSNVTYTSGAALTGFLDPSAPPTTISFIETVSGAPFSVMAETAMANNSGISVSGWYPVQP